MCMKGNYRTPPKAATLFAAFACRRAIGAHPSSDVALAELAHKKKLRAGRVPSGTSSRTTAQLFAFSEKRFDAEAGTCRF